MVVSDKLATLLWRLIEHLGNRPNFRGYSYLDDMKGDAMAHMLASNVSPRYRHDTRPHILKFNPNVGSEAFSYATTIAWQVFLRRIEVEEKQHRIRDDMLIDAGMEPSNKRQSEIAEGWSSEPIPPRKKRGPLPKVDKA